MMLDNAREHGVEVHEGVRVLEVLFEGERAVGVGCMDEDGTRARSARQSGRRCQRPKHACSPTASSCAWDPVLKKGAVWTYCEGAYRDTGRDEGATMVLQTAGKKGWFWYIPLHDNIVSVGVVAPFDYLFKGRGNHEKIYHEEVERCPAVKERVAIGKRVTGFFATKDYSYRSRQAAGDGWVLVGDAFGFLDPLYSSGVLLALKSGQLAADAVAEGLAKGDTSAAQLGNWGPTSSRAWTACGGWSANTTTASASAGSSRSYPAPQGAHHRPADRRPVQGQRRRSHRADGLDQGKRRVPLRQNAGVTHQRPNKRQPGPSFSALATARAIARRPVGRSRRASARRSSSRSGCSSAANSVSCKSPVRSFRDLREPARACPAESRCSSSSCARICLARSTTAPARRPAGPRGCRSSCRPRRRRSCAGTRPRPATRAPPR